MPNDVDDLSTIFVPIGTGPMYATPTGFIDPNTNKDLRETFAVNTTNTILEDTKLIAQNGIDLRYIFQGFEPYIVTIGGTGTYTQNITGNKYIYTFTNGTFSNGTNTISINKNITSFNVIVVGSGGPGRNGSTVTLGNGGGGAGFGCVTFSYVANTIYNISVAPVSSRRIDGQTSFFRNSGGIGVTSTGGMSGTSTSSVTIRAQSGVCTNNGIGTLVSLTGGTGGAEGDPNGTNSSGSITVLGVTYNYGGGGRAGNGTSASANNKGGMPGADGVGGTGITSTINGGDASTPGSGGGGAAWQGSSFGGFGGPGLVMIIFT